MKTFGEHEVKSNENNLDAGMYGAMIESVDLVLDNEGKPEETKDGKKKVDVRFVVDADHRPRRRFTISFGKNNQSGKYAAFAEFLEAASGVKCGDKAQRNLGPDDVVGKTVRIVLKENEEGYMNVTDVLPPGKQSAKPKPQPSGFDGDDEPMDFPDNP